MLASTSPATSSFRPTQPIHARLRRKGLRLARPWIDRTVSRVTANVPVLEAALARVDATLSLHRVLARVVEVRDETHDVKTYILKPNARFGEYRPGAYVNVHLVIDGKPVQRTYSLASAPRAAGSLISITVKRVPGGLVSNYLADKIAPGHILELSAPQGQFTLPERVPEQLLMISAGSGITPVMSMLRHLVRTKSQAKVTFLHFARTPADIIFAEELAAVARELPNVQVSLCVEQAGPGWSGRVGRFDQELIENVAPDFRTMDTFLCGPGGFMRAVMHTYERAGADLSKLRYELFNIEFNVSDCVESSRIVRFKRSGLELLSSKPLTILQQAEARGVHVETGCRAGTCGTCRCRKTSGVVLNLATNRESGAGEELIYPCVSVAQGTVEIDL